MKKPTRPQPFATAVQKPIAPPVYRPQPTPAVLQRKLSPAPPPPSSMAKSTPTAPPVYSPQPVPRVLQRKQAGVQPSVKGVRPRPPAAPAALRSTSAAKCLQPKMNAREHLAGSPAANKARPESAPPRVAAAGALRAASVPPANRQPGPGARAATPPPRAALQPSTARPVAGTPPATRPGHPKFENRGGRVNTVQLLKRYNHRDRLYINDEDNDPPPEGYQQVAPDAHDTTQFPWTPRAPLIGRVGTNTYDNLRANLTNVDAQNWNVPIAVKGGIFTEAMSCCTSIGFRAYYNGELYTAMYHNTGTDQTHQQIFNSILRPLILKFGQDGLPAFGDLTNVKFFAVGGSQLSEETCISIQQAFSFYLAQEHERELMLFSGLPNTLTKNSMVDEKGNITYSVG